MWIFYSLSVNSFLIDQSSLPFLILVFLLSGICLYTAGTESNTTNYVTLVLVMLILLFILFLLWNIFVFFIYYEFLVITLFLCLFLFSASFFKVRSAFYFFIFSLFGSIFFFYIIAILPIIIKVFGSFTGSSLMILSAIIFSLPFLVKLPSFPFSYWLPEVHTEANTSISVILAGLILKLGIFGIMRYCYMTFDLFYSIINSGLLTLTLIIILIIMCSFFRFAVDLKKIIAFSSITHLNLTFAALITLNNSGILTAIITSFAHGLSSVALFLFVGSIIARTYSRNIDSLFFLDFQSRVILLFLLLFNLSFPLTLNFLGELLAVVSLISVSSFFAFIFMLSSLVFTLFWFFIYNRKLPYYPIRLHLFSTEKYITIWLCILLMSSGIFFISLSPFAFRCNRRFFSGNNDQKYKVILRASQGYTCENCHSSLCRFCRRHVSVRAALNCNTSIMACCCGHKCGNCNKSICSCRNCVRQSGYCGDSCSGSNSSSSSSFAYFSDKLNFSSFGFIVFIIKLGIFIISLL